MSKLKDLICRVLFDTVIGQWDRDSGSTITYWECHLEEYSDIALIASVSNAIATATASYLFTTYLLNKRRTPIPKQPIQCT